MRIQLRSLGGALRGYAFRLTLISPLSNSSRSAALSKRFNMRDSIPCGRVGHKLESCPYTTRSSVKEDEREREDEREVESDNSNTNGQMALGRSCTKKKRLQEG